MPIFVDGGWCVYILNVERKKVFIIDFQNTPEEDEDEEDKRHEDRILVLVRRLIMW